jgi:hypothetical protein
MKMLMTTSTGRGKPTEHHMCGSLMAVDLGTGSPDSEKCDARLAKLPDIVQSHTIALNRASAQPHDLASTMAFSGGLFFILAMSYPRLFRTLLCDSIPLQPVIRA